MTKPFLGRRSGRHLLQTWSCDDTKENTKGAKPNLIFPRAFLPWQFFFYFFSFLFIQVPNLFLPFLVNSSLFLFSSYFILPLGF